MILRSHRVLLRPYDFHDYEEWVALRRASRAHLQPWEPLWSDEGFSHENFIRRIAYNEIEADAGRMFAFLTFCQDTGRMVGGVTLSQIIMKAARNCFIGYWCGAGYLRQGYTREAVSRTIQFAFDDLQLHRIQASCMPENAPSIALLEKTGFVYEGLAREYLRINGLWHDHNLYGLLARDFTPCPTPLTVKQD